MAKARNKRENTASGASAVVDHDRVALRAYELYIARGRDEGHDLDDWLNAERELNNAGSEAPAADDRGRDES